MPTITDRVRDLAWSTMQRLQFIESRLQWEGHINRWDLTETFGISVPQSTLDFREYMERAPGNTEYDKRLKRYFPLPTFKPVLISDCAEGYLSQLTALAVGGANQSIPNLMGTVPSYDILPTLERRVDSRILQQLLMSMRAKLSVEIHYHSVSHPHSAWRRIAPHSLASDGLRWHVRAYCYAKEEFHDFALGRITDIRDAQASDISATDDAEWNGIVKVTIAPNPALTADQYKIIERDYSMMQGKTEIRVRKSLLPYLKHRLGIDDSAEQSPGVQVVIVNVEAVT